MSADELSLADQWEVLAREKIAARFDGDEKRVAEIAQLQRELADKAVSRVTPLVNAVVRPPAPEGTDG